MNSYQKILMVLLVLFLPVALMAMIIMPNEYVASSIEAIDCDGPLAVMIFVIPCYLVYGLGLFSFGRSYYHHRRWLALVVSVFCGLLLIALSLKTIAAYHSHNDARYEELCGEKW